MGADPQRIDAHLARLGQVEQGFARERGRDRRRGERRSLPALPAGLLQRQELLEAGAHAVRLDVAGEADRTGFAQPAELAAEFLALSRWQARRADRRAMRRASASPGDARRGAPAAGRLLKAMARIASATGPSRGHVGQDQAEPRTPPAPALATRRASVPSMSSASISGSPNGAYLCVHRRTAGAMRPRRVRVNGASPARAPDEGSGPAPPRRAPPPMCLIAGMANSGWKKGLALAGRPASVAHAAAIDRERRPPPRCRRPRIAPRRTAAPAWASPVAAISQRAPKAPGGDLCTVRIEQLIDRRSSTTTQSTSVSAAERDRRRRRRAVDAEMRDEQEVQRNVEEEGRRIDDRRDALLARHDEQRLGGPDRGAQQQAGRQDEQDRVALDEASGRTAPAASAR